MVPAVQGHRRIHKIVVEDGRRLIHFRDRMESILLQQRLQRRVTDGVGYPGIGTVCIIFHHDEPAAGSEMLLQLPQERDLVGDIMQRVGHEHAVCNDGVEVVADKILLQFLYRDRGMAHVQTSEGRWIFVDGIDRAVRREQGSEGVGEQAFPCTKVHPSLATGRRKYSFFNQPDG